MPRTVALPLLRLLPVIALTLSAGAAVAQYGPADPVPDPVTEDAPWLEVVLEGGAVAPLGDLAAGFTNTDHGMGAELGYALGVRTRFYLTRALTVAPSFTYVELGDHDGLTPAGERFKVVPSILRYGIDLCWVSPGERGQVRLLAGLGLAVLRNRYRDEVPDEETFYEAAVNSIAPSLRAGLRWQDLELSLQYEFDRFATGRFTADLRERDFTWDHVVVRLGYVLPRS
jgi:hypothetical protein